VNIQLIEDGNFKRWVRTSLLVVGLLVMFIAIKYVPPAPFGGVLLLVGLAIAAAGGYASRAHLVGIKPFGVNYKKIRKSYETKEDNEKPQ
jgi:hypothetical protein